MMVDLAPISFRFGFLVALTIPWMYFSLNIAASNYCQGCAVPPVVMMEATPCTLQNNTDKEDATDATEVTPTTPACDNFFTVLASAWLPNEGNCSTVYVKYRDMILEHDDAMKRMNKTLTIFTTWTKQELQNDGCDSLDNFIDDFPNKLSQNVKLQQFDPKTLLKKHGFSDQQINWMQHWQDSAPRFHHTVTRLSDVFRIVLQREYGMAYADLDIIYLLDDPRVYLTIPNVAAPIWSEEKGAFEIQNSAFCFSKPQLDILLEQVHTIMNRKGDAQLTKNRYIYTELGPNLFQHTIQAMQTRGAIQLYYTHSDDHWKIDHVAGLAKSYGGFVWLHLDASNRRRNYYANKQRTYRQLVAEMKEKVQIAKLEQVLPKFLLEEG